MIEPTYALQVAMTAALKAGQGVGAPLFDRVPVTTPDPYVSLGDHQFVPAAADCLDRLGAVHSTLHVFSTAYGSKEARAIAGAIIDRLDHAVLDLGPDWGAIEIAFTGSRIVPEPDGKTSHVVITFTTLLDPA
ncbi:DUF3168 domain-containing protein [Lichenihabitans psoromatis]|uniref:DUF3168 domain-containing protein n=1 Tax=Lichenihabitans psoromatis TaxID=2528642 RepID=UPI00103857BD|nr:DUF3168 domain-containing protein [Lichenihabitans psoromatis]